MSIDMRQLHVAVSEVIRTSRGFVQFLPSPEISPEALRVMNEHTTTLLDLCIASGLVKDSKEVRTIRSIFEGQQGPSASDPGIN